MAGWSFFLEFQSSVENPGPNWLNTRHSDIPSINRWIKLNRNPQWVWILQLLCDEMRQKRWHKKWKNCIFKAGQGWSVWCEYPWQIATIYPNAAPPSITAVLRLSKHNLISFQNLNLFSKQHLNSCFFKTRVILQYMFKHGLMEYGRVKGWKVEEDHVLKMKRKKATRDGGSDAP